MKVSKGKKKRRKAKKRRNQNLLTDPRPGVPLQLPDPVPRLPEALPVPDVEHHGRRRGPSVIQRSEARVALLARRVPDLELAGPAVGERRAVAEVGGSDGDLGPGVEAASDVAEHEAGLADAWAGCGERER